MAARGAKGGWGRLLRYIVGGTLCLLTVVATWAGLQWYWSLVGFCVAFLFILGRRRIFRAGISRSADEIECRYIPWYEGNAYFLSVGLPLMGVASTAAGFAPGNPKWLRFTGIILLCVMPAIVFSVVTMWRRCFLRISPSTLTVRLAASKDESIEITRERVQSITPRMIQNAVNGTRSLQVEIAYRAADLSGDTTKTVLLGLQLTVQPTNLLNALVAWKEATLDDPTELLDRIERILLGRSMAGV
ncbi:hypothetical protein [Mycolicibacterium moriokaense]|uniref:Uncharacterized protein n=1 Tax=Mycolicibacterium moriokaense TaxID=39691 RepID=A0A318HNB5_9MYCO|nr:hypothetical protein [Mycolicibacterium moriokaense]PXX13194.1 hypothetical protein C8E89_101343 [Mycolicibacterium moriokaense]